MILKRVLIPMVNDPRQSHSGQVAQQNIGGFHSLAPQSQFRQCRLYRPEDYATPYERFRSLPEAYRYLKDGIAWELLDGRAYPHSETEATRRMMRAKAELLRRCKLESPLPTTAEPAKGQSSVEQGKERRQPL
jgi:hypothetical protein